jgi:transposase, IS5 family
VRSNRLADKLEHFVPLVKQGIDQAARRVLQEEQVSASEKILSLFEEHTIIITRRKIGKAREFGRKILLDEVDGSIISR